MSANTAQRRGAQGQQQTTVVGALMDIKEAARHAKKYVEDLFTEEGIKDVGLEEIEFDGTSGAWRVTVGFSRPWDRAKEPLLASVTEIAGVPRKRVRDMKIVTLDDTEGRILSVKNRE